MLHHFRQYSTNKSDLFGEGEVARYPLHSLQKQDAGFVIVRVCPHRHRKLRAWFTHCIYLQRSVYVSKKTVLWDRYT